MKEGSKYQICYNTHTQTYMHMCVHIYIHIFMYTTYIDIRKLMECGIVVNKY